VNKGDTWEGVSEWPGGSPESVRTIVSHCDIGHNLLEGRLSLYKLLVFSIGCMELSSEFLRSSKALVHARATRTVVDADLNLAPLEELCILTWLCHYVGRSRTA
jgi:hypothetical protein